jgi:hypothetical protein
LNGRDNIGWISPELIIMGGAPTKAKDLTYSHTLDMVFHMKTTLNIDDTVMDRLRREAARQGKTMSELVEAALRLLFHEHKRAAKKKLRPLPRFHGGKPLVDIADRNALYDAMEGRR